MRTEMNENRNMNESKYIVSADKVWELAQQIRKNRPIVHCITNAVTVNDCANILLAVGASPTMAHHPLEVEEITAGAAALVCNFGATCDYEAMLTAGKKARVLEHPIVVDPVEYPDPAIGEVCVWSFWKKYILPVSGEIIRKSVR